MKGNAALSVFSPVHLQKSDFKILRRRLGVLKWDLCRGMPWGQNRLFLEAVGYPEDDHCTYDGCAELSEDTAPLYAEE